MPLPLGSLCKVKFEHLSVYRFQKSEFSFSFLKNSQVQISSKLNEEKPYDYLLII